jgi:hypothetical protein
MKKIKVILCELGIIIGTAYVTYHYCNKTNIQKMKQTNCEREKFYYMFRFADDWVNKKIKGKNVEDYLHNKNYKNIAIYGMSYIGQTLINELENSDICIKYGIDKDAEVYWDKFPIVKPDEVTDNVDVIVVTAISFLDEVKNTLQGKVKCPIISLEEIVDNL